MDKERKTIGLDSTIIFKRNVKSSELTAIIPQNFQGDIIINGNLDIKEDLCIRCNNLYAVNVISECASIYVEGNLYSIEDLWCDNLKVNGSFYCEGKVDSMDILVSQDFIAKSLETNGFEVTIGGDFICDNVESMESITVYGKTQTKCVIMAEDIDLKGPIEALGIKNSIV